MNSVLANLHEILAHYSPYGWFLAVWTIPLTVLCASGVALVRGAEANRSSVATPRASPAATPTVRLAFLSVLLLAFVCIYAYVVFYNEDLVGLDYAQLTARRFPVMPIWPESGRFFPLAFQEYSLIGLFGRSAPLYHGFSILELVVVLICVFQILDTTPPWIRCLVIISMMTLPSFVHSFFGLVYPERDMILWIGVWILCLQSFTRTNSRTSFVGALIAAQFILYYKETAFILIGGFAGARLLSNAWASGLRGGRFVRFVKENAIEFAHLALCAVFVVVYLVAIRPHTTASYASGSGDSVVSVLSGYLHSDLMFGILALALAGRLAHAVYRKRPLDPLWEPLAVGALVFALAYVKLGMMREYYLAPVDFIATLYVVRLATAAWPALRIDRRLLVASAALGVGLVVQHNVGASAADILTRKQFVDGNVRLASFLEEYSRANEGGNLTLFLPQAGGYQLMEFSAFLSYRGFRPAADSSSDSTRGPSFVVKNPHRFPGDFCHPTQQLRCLYAPTPQPNDLIVILPGQQVSTSQLESWRGTAHEIFHYRSEPRVVERVLQALVPADRLVDAPTDAYVFKN